MSTSGIEIKEATATTVTVAKRANWRLIGRGEGISWPDLDEDISVQGLLAGRRSAETQDSLRRWLQERTKTT